MALTYKDFQEMDRCATEEFHIPIEILMESAGRAVFEEILKLQESKNLELQSVLVICGSGHNGGDGLACARFLKQSGTLVKAILLKDPSLLKGASQNQFEKLKSEKVPYLVLPNQEILLKEIRGSSLIVDAILGTGFNGVVSAPLSSVISTINHSKKYVLAIDIPSGLETDSGETKGECIQATLTVTFVTMKQGFLNPKAKRWTGEIIVRDIGLPKALLERFKKKSVDPSVSFLK